MKKITQLFFILFISLSVQAQKNVILKIYKKLGTNTFAINQIGQNNLLQNFKITRMADRKSNRMGAIMTHVLGITGLQPGPA